MAWRLTFPTAPLSKPPPAPATREMLSLNVSAESFACKSYFYSRSEKFVFDKDVLPPSGSPVIAPFGSLSLQSPEELVGGASGSLLLFDGMIFKPVCDAGFSTEHAQAACRQLGYHTGRALPNS